MMQGGPERTNDTGVAALHGGTRCLPPDRKVMLLIKVADNECYFAGALKLPVPLQCSLLCAKRLPANFICLCNLEFPGF